MPILTSIGRKPTGLTAQQRSEQDKKELAFYYAQFLRNKQIQKQKEEQQKKLSETKLQPQRVTQPQNTVQNQQSQQQIQQRQKPANSEDNQLSNSPQPQTPNQPSVLNNPTFKQMYGNNSQNKKTLDKYVKDSSDIGSSTTQNIKGGRRQVENEFLANQHAERQKKLDLMLDLETKRLQEQYNVGGNSINTNIQDRMDKISKEVSSTYRYFKDTDYLPMSNNDYKILAAGYDARKKRYGQKNADLWLDSEYQRKAANNQNYFTKYINAFSHMGVQATSALISAGGMAYGALKWFIGQGRDNPNVNNLAEFWDNVIDNEVTRYADTIEKAGSMLPSAIQKTQESATKYNPYGIANDAILETPEDADRAISWNTIPQAFYSGGFTLASLLLGRVNAKIADWTIGSLSKAAVSANAAGKFIKSEEALTKTLETLKKSQNAFNVFINPTLLGTAEGAQNALQTKQQVAQQGFQELDEKFKEAVKKEAERRFNNDKLNPWIAAGEGNNMQRKYDISHFFGEVFNEYRPLYQQSADQIDYVSTKAGLQDFATNSAINGAINSTLKATIFGKRTQEALRNSKLFGWSFYKPRLSVSGTPGTSSAVATAVKMPKWVRGVNALKEVGGEAFEEGSQNISSETWQGGARNNITTFINNKLFGDGSVQVGQDFSSEYAASWAAFTNSLTSLETAKSAILGGLSSALGTPFIMRRNYHRDENGNLVKNSFFSKDNFRRGLNARGERESLWEYTQRMTPWRSGVTSSIQQAKDEELRQEDVAKQVTRWLQDPQNKSKWDGLVGSYNFMNQMQQSAQTNDQYSFRNSRQGQLINDVIMLQHLEGTAFHDSFMNDVKRAASGDIDQTLIDQVRQDGKEDLKGKSDEEIKTSIQDNATKMLDMVDKVQKHSDYLDGLMGRMDDDTKESLIYGKMMMEDFSRRKQELLDKERELKAQITSSISSINSRLTDEQKKIIHKYGTLSNALSARKSIENKIKDLEEQSEELRKKINNTENTSKREDLQYKQNQIDNTINYHKRKLSQFDGLNLSEDGKSILDKDGKTIENPNDEAILNEQEIMDLDPIERARMLQKGAAREYNARHQDTQQINGLKQQINEIQEQIDNIEEQRKETLQKLQELEIKRQRIKGNRKTNLKNHAQVSVLNVQIKEAKKQRDRLVNEAKKLNTQKKILNQDLIRIQDKVKKNKRFYSDEQQAVIDNLVRQGQELDENFLDNVVDVGRLEAAMDSFTNDYQSILSDPDAFGKYVQRQKAFAKQYQLGKRAEIIADIEDYEEFAKELDALLAGTSENENKYILAVLQIKDSERRKAQREEQEQIEEIEEDEELQDDNEDNDKQITNELSNFQKYIENKKKDEHFKLMIIINRDFTDNDKSILIDAIQYLQSKGVDIYDKDEVTKALAEEDEDGSVGGEFRQYIEKLNNEREEPKTTTTFTSIGRIISQYQKGLDMFKQYQRTVEQTQPTVEAAPTNETPVPPPTQPEPSNEVEKEDNSSNEQEGKSEEGKTKNESKEEEITSTEDSNTSETETTNSTENKEEESTENKDTSESDTATVIKKLFYPIVSPNMIKIVDYMAERMDKRDPKLLKEFEKIIQEAIDETTDIYSANNSQGVNTLEDFMDLYSTIISVLREKANKEENAKNLYDTVISVVKEMYDKTAIVAANPSIVSGLQLENTRASRVVSMNINGMRAVSKDKTVKPWPVRFYSQYDIDNFLRTHKLDPKTSVLFVTNPDWSNEVMNEMKGYEVLNHLPIVAVIQISNPTEAEKKTCLNINGLYYQPIAVMASSNANLSGAAYNKELRKLAYSNLNSGVQFITKNGKEVKFTLYGKGIVAKHPDSKGKDRRDNSENNDTNMIDDIINNIISDESERNRLLNMSVAERVNDEAYIRARETLLNSIYWEKEGNGGLNNNVVVKPYDMKDNAASSMLVRAVDMNEAKSRKTGELLPTLLTRYTGSAEDQNALIEFNSRTQRLYHEIFLPIVQPVRGKHGDVQAKVITKENQKDADKEAKRLTNWLNGYNKNDNDTKGLPGTKSIVYTNAYTFKVVYNPNDKRNVKGENEESSKSVYSVYLIGRNPSNRIKIGEIVAGEKDTKAAVDLMRNFLYDENTQKIREELKWQIPSGDAANLHNKTASGDIARKNFRAMIDDGLLKFAGSSSQYEVSYMQFSPSSEVKLPDAPSDVVANGDNANQGSSVDQSAASEGSITQEDGTQIDPDSGTVVKEGDTDNSEKEKNKEKKQEERVDNIPDNDALVQKIKATIEKLQLLNASGGYHLSRDENYYYSGIYNNEEGSVLYARVTRIKETDEEVTPYNPPMKDIIHELENNVLLNIKGVLSDNDIKNIKSNKDLLEILKKKGKNISKEDILKAIANLRTEHSKLEYGAWSTPSTAIGNIVDNIFRDFFAGELKNYSAYPNIQKDDFRNLIEQIKVFKTNLDNAGITIISKGITTSGKVDLIDGNGKAHTIMAAGTLDLIGYDKKGKLHIFDMKTVRNLVQSKRSNNGFTNIVEEQKLNDRMHKWQRQLSIYAQLLTTKGDIVYFEDMNPSDIELHIIPISVSYPTPKGESSQHLDPTGPQYSVGEKGQLLANDEPITVAPIMGYTTVDQYPVSYREPELRWDNATSLDQILDQEKGYFSLKELEESQKYEAALRDLFKALHDNNLTSVQEIVKNISYFWPDFYKRDQAAIENEIKKLAPAIDTNGEEQDLPSVSEVFDIDPLKYQNFIRKFAEYLELMDEDDWRTQARRNYAIALNTGFEAREYLRQMLKCSL